jgi:hypothetical protein
MVVFGMVTKARVARASRCANLAQNGTQRDWKQKDNHAPRRVAKPAGMPLTAAPYVPMAPANYLILLIRDPPKADIAQRN